MQFDHIAKKIQLVRCWKGRQTDCEIEPYIFLNPDQPHIIRRQLQEIKQDSEATIDEFAERIEDFAADGYHGTPEYF